VRIVACRLAKFSRAAYYKKSRAKDQSHLRMRIREIAQNRHLFGYARIHVMLRRKGWNINFKRVHRLYCLEGLQLRMKVRTKKSLSLHRNSRVRSELSQLIAQCTFHKTSNSNILRPNGYTQIKIRQCPLSEKHRSQP
jgi:HTH-like domain